MGALIGFIVCGLIYFVWNVLNGWDVDDDIPPITDKKKG